MNWVNYLSQNSQIKDPHSTKDIARAAEIAAIAMSFEHGWKDFSVVCSSKTLHLYYTTDSGLYAAMIPLEIVVPNPVIRPVLEAAVRGHSKNIYRK